MKKRKIAIIGAGFCGMAAAYILTRHHRFTVDLYDPGKIGDNASGISAGLLHPYTGKAAKLAQWAKEGMQSTLELAKEVQQARKKPSILPTGMLRFAITDEQKEHFKRTAEAYPDVEWLEPELCQKLHPGVAYEPAILIKSAHLVDTKAYLRDLYEACLDRGVLWINQTIHSLKEVSHYDAVVVAAGANTASIAELSHLRVKPVKGQILEIEWPEKLTPLKQPINSKVYLVPNPINPKTVYLGATYERNFESEKPDPDVAANYLFPYLKALYPEFGPPKIINCFAASRASTPDHLPIARQEGKNLFVLTGMGSKGLLYHALFAKKIVHSLTKIAT